MGMYGADVAQLRSLAAQFDRGAEVLSRQRAAVGHAVQQSAWAGPDGAQFRSDWQSHHSLRVEDAARLLRDVAAMVRRNADEQDRASAVNGGPTVGGVSFGGVGSASVPTGLAGSALGFAGRALDGAVSLVDAIRAEALPHGIGAWDAVSAVTNAAGVAGVRLPFIGGVGSLMDGVGVIDKIRHGTFDIFDGADLAATALRDIPGPIAKLGAAAIDSVAFAGQQVMNADFSAENFASVASYAAEHPAAVVQSLGEAVGTVGADFVLPELKKAGFPLVTAAVESTSYAVQEGMKADWSPEARTLVADYVVQHPAETLQSMGGSIMTVAGKAVSWFK